MATLGWSLFGFVVAFYLCDAADTKSIQTGRIRIKGKWYKLTPMEDDEL